MLQAMIRRVAPHVGCQLVFLALPLLALGQRHHHEEHVHKNEVAFFLGGTTESHDDETETFLTVGADYEHRFHPRLGISFEAEWVTDVDSAVFAFPAVVHVYKGLMVMVGPGWETAPRRFRVFGKERSFLMRTGVQYSFEIGERVSLIPALDFDFVRRTPLELPEGASELGLGFDATEGGAEWERLVVFGVKLAFSF